MPEKIINSEVFCTVTVEGIHCWPNCPIDEVSYLRDPHRHQFVITSHKTVFHDDRDEEFIHLQHKIRTYLYDTYGGDGPLDTGVCHFNSKSCEMIARELIDRFGLSKCCVSEDGENGAILTDVTPISFFDPSVET